MNQKFIQNAIDLHGEDGKKWIERIPEVIRKYEEKWEIVVNDPFSLSYNYVAPAKSKDREDRVIKIGFPGDREFLSEMESLSFFHGEGVEKIFAQDKKDMVMLLERVIPGKTLDSLDNDAEQTKIACQVLEKLWKPAPKEHSLIVLNNWLNGFQRHKDKFNGTSGPFPQELFTLADNFNQKLYMSLPEHPVLLHGDFHHLNILSSEREGWLAIDPKGIIGHKEYDVATFLNNPSPKFGNRPDAKELVKKRIEIFSSELGLDRKRIIEWGITQAVLSAIWTLEDHGNGWEYGITFATLLSSL